jgi:hypothetical protein
MAWQRKANCRAELVCAFASTMPRRVGWRAMVPELASRHVMTSSRIVASRIAERGADIEAKSRPNRLPGVLFPATRQQKRWLEINTKHDLARSK